MSQPSKLPVPWKRQVGCFFCLPSFLPPHIYSSGSHWRLEDIKQKHKQKFSSSDPFLFCGLHLNYAFKLRVFIINLVDFFSVQNVSLIGTGFYGYSQQCEFNQTASVQNGRAYYFNFYLIRNAFLIADCQLEGHAL